MRITWMFTLLFALYQTPALYGAPTQGYVQREGARLELNGQSHYISGANQYYLFYKSRAMVDEVLEDAVALGLNVIRTWAFCDGEWHDGHSLQPEPGVFNEQTFQNLDYVIYRAEQLGLRVTLPLVNNWDAFGGMNTYVKWAKTAQNHDDFYSNAETRTLFKNYISYVLNRKNTYTGRAYKDEPAILMWELANEPRIAQSRVGELYEWIDHMAGYIKSIDQNHLVTTGSEGDLEGDLYASHASSNIDVVSFHLYPEDWNFSQEKTLAYITRQIKIAKEVLKKPVYCAEFGIRDLKLRDDIYASWYKIFQSHEIDGALFWILSGRMDHGPLYPDFDGFTIYYPESSTTIPLIKNHSTWAATKSGKDLDLEAPTLRLDRWRDGAIVQGDIEFSGEAYDNRLLTSVTIDFGGVPRAATLQQGHWHFFWNSREFLDGAKTIRLVAQDAEGNTTEQHLTINVDNGGYKSDDWKLQGRREQDDGYNYIYFVSAKNNTGHTESGHFTVRYYLRAEGALRIGTHYENSDVYQGNPSVSSFKDFIGDVRYIDIDLGTRMVAPGERLSFKGQLTQSDGGLKSNNDWSGDDIPTSEGEVKKILWLKDGQVIAGNAP